MSILTVNLKHLYQRRGLWLVYVILVLFAFAGIAVLFKGPEAGQGRFIGLIVLAFVIGLLLAVLPLEVLSKPFSYCLPGHRKMVRRLVFCVGIVFNLLASLLFFIYPDLSVGQLLLVVCSAFVAGLISYLLGAGLAFGIRNSVAFIGFLPLVIVTGGFFDLHTVLERVIVENPLVVISVGILSSCVVWFWLGDEGRARRYCNVPWVGFFDAWNPDKMKRISRIRMAGKWKKLEKYTNLRIENFYLGRMNRYDYVSAGRYIWGALYAASVAPVLHWNSILSIVIMVILMSFLLGYMGPAATFMFFFIPIMIVMNMRLPVHSSMLISGGRRERFAGSIAAVAAAVVPISVVVIAMVALSMLLEMVIPEFTWRGVNFTYRVINAGNLFIPLVITPFAFAIRLIFYRRPVYTMLLLMLIIYLMIFTALIWSKQLSAMINLISITAMLVLGWGTVLLVLRYVCMKRSLTGNG
ncbi:MAG: hypothetical protein GWN67_15690 [Phycisphaerae bacterium]|nr:hypothetical protein [Phycisphaerae bacterium]NIP54145.1 hypothetical protein [Phycisphaerae bacterium]NIS53035.1 hypothetical protein [Phycisphaerae bacterium]NIU10053.1 hypothetical protein [Phycisphaerae bacterium]NIU57775.1 hypothetical protein [Phycisphaerae bacterium]